MSSFGEQVWLSVLQYCVDVQSVSSLQPVFGVTEAPHRPLALHVPVRQTVAPLLEVQGPSPSIRPHLLSMSHMPLWQTDVPTRVLQVPLSAGSCSRIVGTLEPFVSFGTQRFCSVSQNWADVQSASTKQPPTGAHFPDTEQALLRHTTAALLLSQGPSPMA